MYLRAEVALKVLKKAKWLLVSYLLICSWMEIMPGQEAWLWCIWMLKFSCNTQGGSWKEVRAEVSCNY